MRLRDHRKISNPTRLRIRNPLMGLPSAINFPSLSGSATAFKSRAKKGGRKTGGHGMTIRRIRMPDGGRNPDGSFANNRADHFDKLQKAL